jgi:pimeloyl-ACP methyl ester carboxylesterase
VLVGAVGLVGRDPVAAGRVADTGAEGVRAKLTFLVHDPALVTEGWVAEELAVNSSPGAADALARVADYLRDGVPADLVGDRYAAAGIPTLLVWGSEDRWVPAEVGRRCAELLPHAPLVLLDGAGHAPYYERPAAFGDVVEDFLRRPEGRRPGERHIP